MHRKLADYTWATRTTPLTLPVTYFPGLETDIECWAEEIGWHTDTLRQAAESVVRNSHHAATITCKAIGSAPEVYQLGIESLLVFYTVEPLAIVVRGFALNLPDYQTPDNLAGRYFCDSDWGVPRCMR